MFFGGENSVTGSCFPWGKQNAGREIQKGEHFKKKKKDSHGVLGAIGKT